jgi:hypothetical protein
VSALVDTIAGASSSTVQAPAMSAQAAPSPSAVVAAEKQ